MKTKTNNTFKKSVLSILVISAVAGTFIPWEKYQPKEESPGMVSFYENQDEGHDSIVSRNITTDTDAEILVRLAEDNLMIDAGPELIASENIEKNTSLETNESYDDAIDETQSAQIEALPTSLDEVTIGSVMDSPLLFAFDSSEIKQQYYQALNETAQFMKNADQQQEVVWQVVGYADLSGNYIYNSKLAKKRAQSVANYLVDKGVNEEQLSIVSLGTSQQLNAKRSVENNKSERRVEIHVYQPEVTVLAQQYNNDIDRERTFIKSQEVAKTELIVEPKVAEIINPESSPEKTPVVEFEKIKAERLSTAMEL